MTYKKKFKQMSYWYTGMIENTSGFGWDCTGLGVCRLNKVFQSRQPTEIFLRGGVKNIYII